MAWKYVLFQQQSMVIISTTLQGKFPTLYSYPHTLQCISQQQTLKKFTFDPGIWLLLLLLLSVLPICKQPRPYFGDHDCTHKIYLYALSNFVLKWLTKSITVGHGARSKEVRTSVRSKVVGTSVHYNYVNSWSTKILSSEPCASAE